MTDSAKPRARDLGIPFDGSPGPLNSVTDVEGLEVGHATLISGTVISGTGISGSPGPGSAQPVIRTGVTALHAIGKGEPRGVAAGWFSLNGNGEMTGTTFIDEYGSLFGPVVLTNTLSLGVARDAVIEWSRDTVSDRLALAARSLPVVAETWDGKLNDIYGLHVSKEHVFQALNEAESGPVAEGSVGGGTGMTAYEFKAGIGTASRDVESGPGRYTVGVLVQANFGKRGQLIVAGVPVGRELTELMPEGAARSMDDGSPAPGGDGSVIVVVATDAPLLPIQLTALAKRVSLGLGRNGSIAANTSGDIFLAFSTANTTSYGSRGLHRFDFVPTEELDPFFTATIEATEEAVINALVAAETMEGKDGVVYHALPHDRLRELLARHGRLAK